VSEVAKIGMCGHFGGELEFFDGQTIKTKVLFNELQEFLGRNEVIALDTYNWRKASFKLLVRCIKLIKNSDNIIILPAQNGIKIFVPLFTILNRRYKKNLHYVVIGGWLPELAGDKKYLLKHLIQFNNIFVETRSMQNNLNLLGLNNVSILPNFKRLRILKEDELVLKYSEPYKLCTFSRVTKEKGIEDAIEAVIEVNNTVGRIVCCLDIYGQIDDGYRERFEQLQKDFPDYIAYKGVVDFDKSVDVVKKYFALLFPTYYEGEGFAGTILDAFAAGVPVIATNWRYNAEIIQDKVDGFIYDYKKPEMLKEILLEIHDKPEDLINMKKNCLKRAKDYSPDTIVMKLVEYLNYWPQGE
jgi:glycosyltransferase involved in cell wall biosynthesis